MLLLSDASSEPANGALGSLGCDSLPQAWGAFCKKIITQRAKAERTALAGIEAVKYS